MTAHDIASLAAIISAAHGAHVGVEHLPADECRCYVCDGLLSEHEIATTEGYAQPTCVACNDHFL